MKKILSILALMALMPLAFASSDCEESCCYYAGGSWDYDYGYCSNPDSSYYDCINQCEGTYGFDYSCCGPMFLLAGLGGAAFLANRK